MYRDSLRVLPLGLKLVPSRNHPVPVEDKARARNPRALTFYAFAPLNRVHCEAAHGRHADSRAALSGARVVVLFWAMLLTG